MCSHLFLLAAEPELFLLLFFYDHLWSLKKEEENKAIRATVQQLHLFHALKGY
jgi:hypothetical protein